MNLRHLIVGLLLAATAALHAEPLTRAASVYARPEPSATVLKVLPVGTEPTPALNPSEPAPAGSPLCAHPLNARPCGGPGESPCSAP